MLQDCLYVTFGIGREVFAISVDAVQEILDLRAVSRIPHSPSYVLGLMEFREAGILIIDLRTKLGLPAIEPTERTRVIVIEAAANERPAVGLVSDYVFEVTDFGALNLQPPPSTGRQWRSAAIVGGGRRGEDFVIVLDLNWLLQDETPGLEAA